MSSAHFSILFEVNFFLYIVTNMFFLCIPIHFAYLCEYDALYASTQSKAAALKCILRIKLYSMSTHQLGLKESPEGAEAINGNCEHH